MSSTNLPSPSTGDPSPLVSVIMSVYNGSQYLAESISSVLAQTMPDLELICLDDGSVDDSLAVLNSYAAQDDRIKVISLPHFGNGRTLNTGLKIACGRYIAIVDQDDFITERMYERLIATAEAYQADFVRADFARFWAMSDKNYAYLPQQLTWRHELYNCLLEPQNNLDAFAASMQSVVGIYRRQFLLDHDIWHRESENANAADNGFWFQTHAWASRVVLLDESFYRHRWDNTYSISRRSDRPWDMLDEYSWIYQLLVDWDDKRHLRPAFHYYKSHNCMFALGQLRDEDQLPFLERYASEYAAADSAGELDRNLFGDDEWEILRRIMADPAAYTQDYRAQLPQRLAARRQLIEQAEADTLRQLAHQRGLLALLNHHLRQDGLIATLRLILRKLLHRSG